MGLWWKQETIEHTHCRDVVTIFNFDRFGNVVNYIKYCLSRLEINSLLAVVANSKRFAPFNRTFVGLKMARHKVEKCTLANSIFTHNAHLLVASEFI